MPDDFSTNISVDALTPAVVVGSTDDTWENKGDVIDMRQDNRLILWYDLVVNDSDRVFMRALPVKTAAGTPYSALDSTIDTWTLGGADSSHWLQFVCDMFPFIQIQTKATDIAVAPGTTVGTIAIDITKVTV